MEPRKVIRSLISTNRIHKKTVDRLTSGVEIKRENRFLLMMLANASEPLSQKEIAKKLSITPAAVARKMKTLESAGFIERKKTGADSRRNNVSITPKGLELKKATDAVFDTVDKKALSGITENELEIFLAVLDKIQENLKEIGGTHNEMD